ncbi:MAG TPA: phosphoglycerate mutase family protein [Opitutaceae bacterium]|nr:phosphoglycerate mutase family protein [Opitutaceae bacterium]
MNTRIPRLIFSLCLAPFLLEGRAAEPVSQPPAPVLIFIVRHAEKSAVSGDVPLSPEGQARAEKLAAMLAPAEFSAVYSSELTFAQQTAVPVARQRKLEPIIVSVRETEKLLAELQKLAPGSVALVVNHSGTIPALVEKLGGAKPSPIEGHDRLFVVSRQTGGAATVAELRYGE